MCSWRPARESRCRRWGGESMREWSGMRGERGVIVARTRVCVCVCVCACARRGGHVVRGLLPIVVRGCCGSLAVAQSLHAGTVRIVSVCSRNYIIRFDIILFIGIYVS